MLESGGHNAEGLPIQVVKNGGQKQQGAQSPFGPETPHANPPTDFCHVNL